MSIINTIALQTYVRIVLYLPTCNLHRLILVINFVRMMYRWRTENVFRWKKLLNEKYVFLILKIVEGILSE